MRRINRFARPHWPRTTPTAVLGRALLLIAVLVLTAPLLLAQQGAPDMDPGAAPDAALASVSPGTTRIYPDGDDIVFDIGLSQAVPYRVDFLAAPARLVVGFYEADWGDITLSTLQGAVPALRQIAAGAAVPGLSRLIAEFDRPYGLKLAGYHKAPDQGGQTVLRLRLGPVSAEDLAAIAIAPQQLWGRPDQTAVPDQAPPDPYDGRRALRVVLDPGHGGIDPGAQRQGVREADLMLTFAAELTDALRRHGMEVSQTRVDDRFVPLEARITAARSAGADVFLSLHADALEDEQQASGATVYTLSQSASDAASRKLAERHDRADLLSGVDLSGQGDGVAGVLMDIARTETRPRTERLANALVQGLRDSVQRLHKRPHLRANFSVLKSPDIPSALIELGFMSNQRDLDNLTDPDWRARAARGITAALQAWALDDAARAALLRQ